MNTFTASKAIARLIICPALKWKPKYAHIIKGRRKKPKEISLVHRDLAAKLQLQAEIERVLPDSIISISDQ